MKIWIQAPGQGPTGNHELQDYLDIVERVKRPDTEVSFQPVPPGRNVPKGGSFYLGVRFFNEREIVRNILRAQEAGYDGVVICCYLQPGLKAARQLLSVPVVGLAESAMLMASLMGLRFAVITSDHRVLDDNMEMIQAAGMTARAISVRPARAISLSEDAFMGCLDRDLKVLVDDFTQVAQGCIDDGAQVVIAGCGLMSKAITQTGLLQIDGVPVIDPIMAAIKIVEMMVDWQRAGFPTVSRHGLFQDIPTRICEEAKISGLIEL